SNELMRHLYQEAAKGVKYGGLSETDALKTITLNGAKQLGLEKRVGSIEVGKDADLAIFNGHPLNSYARVEMTLVEGGVTSERPERARPAGASAAAEKPAEGEPAGKAKPRTLILSVNETKPLSMEGKKRIKNVFNSRPSVARVQPVQGDPTTVLVTG